MALEPALAAKLARLGPGFELSAGHAKRTAAEEAKRRAKVYADAGKEEREKVIMEVVSWMVGEVAARVQETVVDTRGDDVGKEEREKIVREVVSWLVGRVEAQVEDAHREVGLGEREGPDEGERPGRGVASGAHAHSEPQGGPGARVECGERRSERASRSVQRNRPPVAVHYN